MHLRELFTQPVNLIVSMSFVLSFGLIMTSVVFDNAGYPNPITSFVIVIGGAIYDRWM